MSRLAGLRPSIRPFRRDGGVEQRCGRGVDGVRRAAAVPVHSRGHGGAVVEERQLSANRFGIGCAGGLGKFTEEGPQPGPVRVSHDLALIPGSRLRASTDEPASTEFRPFQRVLKLGKNAKQAVSRRVVRREDISDAFLPLPEVVVKVSAHELVFAAEDAVKGGLGDAGPFDNAVNPHDVHPFGVEQLIGRDKQPVSRR